MTSLDVRGPYDPYHVRDPAPWTYPIPQVNAYFGLEIAGFAMLVLLVATTWISKSIRQRDKSLYNFFIVCALACLWHMMTWWTHGKPADAEPPGFGVCLFQSMMVMGNSTAQPAAAIGLIFKVRRTDSPASLVVRQAYRITFVGPSVN
jgi:hypothetical protein